MIWYLSGTFLASSGWRAEIKLYECHVCLVGSDIYRFVFYLSLISWKSFPCRVKNCLCDSDLLQQNAVVFRAYVRSPLSETLSTSLHTVYHRETGTSNVCWCMWEHTERRACKCKEMKAWRGKLEQLQRGTPLILTLMSLLHLQAAQQRQIYGRGLT